VRDNATIVTAFLDAFERMDGDELIEYFQHDAVYHNIPLPALRGREQILESLRGLRRRFQGLRIVTVNQVAAGNLVMNERVDIFLREDQEISLPIAGVFELRNGKIQAWREYFDLPTFKGTAGT
jgi:limonene-1,2-epoxide hydrolase